MYVLYNYLQLLRSFTLRRAGNAFLILFSYFISRFLHLPYIKGYPVAFSVEPTTSCNLRCPECISGLRAFTRNRGMLSLNNFKQWVDQFHKDACYLTLYFQGEPYLNTDFFEMVSYAKQKKIYVSTSTNAHFLTKTNAEKTILSGLSQLIISIDGSTNESYKKYRIGGELEKVIEGVKNLVEARKKLKKMNPLIVFQVIVFRHNEAQLEAIKKLGKELGVDKVQLKSAQIYDYENGSELIPENSRYSRYEKISDGSYRIKNALEDHCWKMWHSCVVTWDGNMVPCCYDKDGKYVMGNIGNEMMQNVWNGKNYKEFRMKLLSGRSNLEMCKNCTEGMKIGI